MKRAERLIGTALLILVSYSAFVCAAPLQDASLVRTDVVVTEARDRKVVGMEKENFQIWEDDVAQEIISISPGSVPGEYVLTFLSTNTAKDGTWRRLRAKVTPPKGLNVAFNVIAKAGYYAPAAGN
jgi:hypothetical protein